MKRKSQSILRMPHINITGNTSPVLNPFSWGQRGSLNERGSEHPWHCATCNAVCKAFRFLDLPISMVLVLVLVLCMHHNHKHVPPNIPPFADMPTRTSDLENSWKKLIHAYPERLCPATRGFLKKELKLKFDFLSASLSLAGSIDGKIIYIFTKTKQNGGVPSLGGGDLVDLDNMGSWSPLLVCRPTPSFTLLLLLDLDAVSWRKYVCKYLQGCTLWCAWALVEITIFGYPLIMIRNRANCS